MTALLRRLIALADLAGVDLSYDLTGLSFASLENPDEEWICAASLAWFLEARSFSKDKHVRVIGEQILSLGSMLAMGFESDDKAPSAAFEEFFRAERERGNAVEITREGDTLLLTFPLAHPEFSLEGGKQRPAAFSITKYINLPIPEEK